MSEKKECINPVRLFDECLLNPEPLFDEFYCFNKLIISESAGNMPTPIMLTNLEVIKRITSAEIALLDNNTKSFEEQVIKIWELLKNEASNLLEFTSFWPCMDVSFSLYKKKLKEEDQKKHLREAIILYIKKRHKVYMSHGYTPTTIQVRKDFEKHKSSGNLGLMKAEKLLEDNRYTKYEKNGFLNKKYVYCHADNAFGINILDVLKKDFGMKFIWEMDHQNKKPDFIIRGSIEKYFIVEMKHEKEVGGGQDKQVSELISLIKEREKSENISYVAFLDGMYFNNFITPQSPKLKNQKNQILEYLNKNSSSPNYFVNTYGFIKLISSL